MKQNLNQAKLPQERDNNDQKKTSNKSRLESKLRSDTMPNRLRISRYALWYQWDFQNYHFQHDSPNCWDTATTIQNKIIWQRKK